MIKKRLSELGFFFVYLLAKPIIDSVRSTRSLFQTVYHPRTWFHATAVTIMIVLFLGTMQQVKILFFFMIIVYAIAEYQDGHWKYIYRQRWND